MPSENHGDKRILTERERSKGLLPPARPSPQSGPPNLTSGLELPRSSDC